MNEPEKWAKPGRVAVIDKDSMREYLRIKRDDRINGHLMIFDRSYKPSKILVASRKAQMIS